MHVAFSAALVVNETKTVTVIEVATCDVHAVSKMFNGEKAVCFIGVEQEVVVVVVVVVVRGSHSMWWLCWCW